MHKRFHELIEDPIWDREVFVLDSNGFGQGETLIALGIQDIFSCSIQNHDGPEQLASWLTTHQDWAFGWISYDVKNAIENLESRHVDILRFDLIHFVCPRVVIRLQNEGIKIEKNT